MSSASLYARTKRQALDAAHVDGLLWCCRQSTHKICCAPESYACGGGVAGVFEKWMERNSTSPQTVHTVLNTTTNVSFHFPGSRVSCRHRQTQLNTKTTHVQRKTRAESDKKTKPMHSIFDTALSRPECSHGKNIQPQSCNSQTPEQSSREWRDCTHFSSRHHHQDCVSIVWVHVRRMWRRF